MIYLFSQTQRLYPGSIHIRPFKTDPKIGFFFLFLTWSSFTCSAAHLGCHIQPQIPPALRLPSCDVGCRTDLSNPQGIVQTLINLSSVL